MLCGLIMAGGIGTRFWPFSTEDKPKQFLKLLGEETMLQTTVNRVLPIIPIDRVFVCTGERYVELVKEQLPNLPMQNIIVEPEGRNTAPCIALSSLIINKVCKDASILVLPSDHLIENEYEFRGLVSKYDKLINHLDNAIITFGMKPLRAETAYGYIKASYSHKNINTNVFYKVEEFVEKPNKETAKNYIDEGCYLWNSGMFLWKARTIINNIKKYLPNTFEALKQIENCNKTQIQKIVDENYFKTDKTSIDFGVLEKAENIYVVPTEVGWDDVGSWESVERYCKKDSRGNIHIGKINSLRSSNNLVVASNQKIVIDGISNIYVVENNGQIIIGQKDEVNNLKDLKNIV